MKNLLLISFSHLFCFAGFGNGVKDSVKRSGKDTLKFQPLPYNSIYLEFLGNGIVESLNYERIISRSGKPVLTARIGCGYLILEYKSFAFPIMVNRVFPIRKKFHFELGLGTTFLYEWSNEDDYKQYNLRCFATALTGIRFQANDGLLARLGFTPLYNPDTSFQPWGGFSVGYSFGKKKNI